MRHHYFTSRKSEFKRKIFVARELLANYVLVDGVIVLRGKSSLEDSTKHLEVLNEFYSELPEIHKEVFLLRHLSENSKTWSQIMAEVDAPIRYQRLIGAHNLKLRELYTKFEQAGCIDSNSLSSDGSEAKYE